MLWIFPLAIDLIFLVISIFFTIESIKEKERRAVRFGLTSILVLILLGVILIFFPGVRFWVGVFFALLILFFLFCLIPGNPNEQAIRGTQGYIKGEVTKFDERDTVFARNRSLPLGSEIYKRYYQLHPEKEEKDTIRRASGPPLGRIGSIDREFRPNVSMLKGTFHLPHALGRKEIVEPFFDPPPFPMNPREATEGIKGFALHLGADLVGICRVNPLWAYSHRGEIFYNNWEDWGKEIPASLPFAIVIATEMDSQLVGAAPHTPSLVESGVNYAKGAFIATALANFIAQLGYEAVAHHFRHYDFILVPLAIDAGLGELGRFGYLITKPFGPRVRLAAVTTSLPLIPDKPIDLGVQEFCTRCLRCAETCPSQAIPRGGKVVFNGVERWKLKEDRCFDYWAKIGTDCNICMAVCPYSRPDQGIHRLARWMVSRSPLSRYLFPYLESWVYGRKWHSKEVPSWIKYSAENP